MSTEITAGNLVDLAADLQDRLGAEQFEATFHPNDFATIFPEIKEWLVDGVFRSAAGPIRVNTDASMPVGQVVLAPVDNLTWNIESLTKRVAKLEEELDYLRRSLNRHVQYRDQKEARS